MSTKKKAVHVYFTEQIMNALKLKKEETGAPVAEIIRRAVDEYLERHETEGGKRKTDKMAMAE